MPSTVFTVNLQVGTATGLLTFFEYLLSTVAALSARAAIHGLFLLNLHRGGNARINPQLRTRRNLAKDAISFLISILLVLGVALVEASLEPGIDIAKEQTNSTKCLSVYGALEGARLTVHRPPFGVTLETWMMQAAERLACPNGIRTLGVMAYTDTSGEKVNLAAPVCANNQSSISTISVNPGRVLVSGGAFTPRTESSPAYLILPQSREDIGKDLNNLGGTLDGQMDCGRNGISNFHLSPMSSFETRNYHVLNVSFATHQRICRAHSARYLSNPLRLINADVMKSCQRGRHDFDISCAHEAAGPDESYEVDLPDVASLLVEGSSPGSRSFACLNATLRIKYGFLDHQYVINKIGAYLYSDVLKPKLPILVPLQITVAEGKCQRTIGAIAQAALFYTLEAKWSRNGYNSICLQTLFYAYMMAVSNSLFPLDELSPPERSVEENGTCMLRRMKTVTFIPKGWRLVILIVGLVVALLTVLVALACRCLFTGESWRVGSANWSLLHLLETEEGNEIQETIIELVEVPNEENHGSPTASKLGGPISSRVLGRHDATPGSSFYQYRLIRNSVPALTRRRSTAR